MGARRSEDGAERSSTTIQGAARVRASQNDAAAWQVHARVLRESPMKLGDRRSALCAQLLVKYWNERLERSDVVTLCVPEPTNRREISIPPG